MRLWRDRPDIFVEEVFGVIPDAWQRDVLQAFPVNQRLAMKACKGPGKLQPKSLRFDTPEGSKLWGDIKKGDYVFAEDGTPTEVLEIFENGVVQQYRVTFNDGSSTLCGAEHLWKVQGRTERRKNLGWNVLTTQEIIDRGVTIPNGEWAQKQFIIPQQEAAQFPYTKQPLDAYVLGVWLGDGTAASGMYSGVDEEVADQIRLRGYTIGPRKDGISATIYKITDHLRELNLLGVNSHNRFIPDIYKYASVEQRKATLMGLMDTDGCIDNDDSHMEFSTTSKQLADDVVWLARSLGGVAFIKDTVKRGSYRKDNVLVECRDCYRVTVTLSFCPFYITRKSIRWHKPNARYLTRYISKIEPEGLEDSMCIKVAHSSSCYLTNDFIVTHNTCLLAWLIWNFLLTRPYPKIAATSITADTLSDTLWSELAKWQQRSELLKSTFTWQKTRIFANESPETWFCSARSWSKSADASQQGNTLAGLHADYILFVLDESGGIPEAIMAAAEAALSSCIEGHIVQAGNPTHLEGPLYRACTSEARLWHVTEITSDPDDPKRTPRVSAQWAREQIEKYGRDNPWVLINVFGQFPPSSLNALIGPDEVKEAMKRHYRPQDFNSAPKILGIDVAREGMDSSVIFPRQGLQAFNPIVYRNIDGTQGAGLVARKWKDWDADAVFIDDTGGFGSSWIDNLRRLGYAPIGVHFAEKAASPRYFNKRSEMMFEAVQWIKEGGALPECPELLAALTQTTYTFKGDKLIIEPKDVIKEKLGYSPDHMDAFILQFAHPVVKTDMRTVNRNSRHTTSYDPLALEYVERDIGGGNHKSDYDPLAY